MNIEITRRYAASPRAKKLGGRRAPNTPTMFEITVDGVTKYMTTRELSDLFGVHQSTINTRIDDGWDPIVAISHYGRKISSGEAAMHGKAGTYRQQFVERFNAFVVDPDQQEVRRLTVKQFLSTPVSTKKPAAEVKTDDRLQKLTEAARLIGDPSLVALAENVTQADRQLQKMIARLAVLIAAAV